MHSIQKILISISLAAGLSWIAAAEAKPLPFIDTNKILINKPAIEIKAKKQPLAQYNGSVELDLSFGDLEDSDIPALITFLNEHPDVTRVNLEGNNKLTAASMVSLASVQTLVELNLNRTYKECPNMKCIGGLEAKDISAFANHPSLTKLNLYMHSIGDQGAIELAKNSRLKVLELSSNNITDVGGVALAANLSLNELGLSANENIGSKTAIALAGNPSLQKLHLGQTNIDDEGVIALASQSHVTDLVLHYMDIGDASATALAQNQYLKSLWLSGTDVSVVGAKALAQNKTIEVLGLGGDFFGDHRPNDIGDIGAVAFAQNQGLRSLDLSSQQITAIGAAELAKNKRLSSLYLAANYSLGDNGVKALVANHGFAILDVSACKLTDKGAIALAEHSYVYLYAQSNFISDAGASAFAQNEHLLSLDLMVNEIHDVSALAFINYSAMPYLNVMFNRMSSIGSTLINNHYGWEAGMENPYPSPEGYKKDNQPRIHHNAKSTTADQTVCYRTKETIECTDKHNIMFSPHGA